jgi:CheY-like chemotaxis protein
VEKPAILLVDDDERERTLITAVLGRDFLVHSASGSTEAIERLRTGRYVAILLDARAGQPAAYDVLDHLQTAHPELVKRALVLTASLSKSEMERVRRHKVFGVISKPFEVDLLHAAVRECVAGRGGRNAPLISGPMLLLLADLLRDRL